MIDARVIVIAVGALLVSLLLTGKFRRYALSRGLMDVPNARSSHEIPTPRGGGLAIVVAVLLALITLATLQLLSVNTAAALYGGGAVAAMIGYLDDRRDVPLLARLAAQFAAAMCVVWFAGVSPVTRALSLPVTADPLVAALAVLFVVWMLNLTNFMDGIDGIASTEVITMSAGVAICVAAAPTGTQTFAAKELLAVVLAIAGATAGFLRWNWPPAKIFMGDAGSGFLGVMLGAMVIMAAGVHPALFWSCGILAGAFVVDATVTLFRRIARREKFYHAHRSHAYQHAARKWNHKTVTTAVAIINIGWLLPLAILAATGHLRGPVALVIAYIPLLALTLRFRAGLPE